MIVSELIELLKTMPQDAVVLHTMMSDYEEIEPDDITLMEPRDGEGLIRHNGHWMLLRKKWWPYAMDPPTNPQFFTVVHFAGN